MALDNQNIIKLILKEIGKDDGREGWEKLMETTKDIVVPAKKAIIVPNKKDNNIYIIKDGLARMVYLNDDGEEVTVAFASAGTCFLSPMSYVRNLPTYYHIIAVTECTLAVTPSSELDRLMLEDAVFACSVFRLCMAQFFAFELKQQSLGGEASENFTQLRKKAVYKKFKDLYMNRPDFLNEVSDKILASYLGVHPVYFSRMKKALLEEDRKSDKSDHSKK